jgi:D-alanyl-D-alanine dipeptidase
MPYRPQSAVDFFFEWSKDLNDTINKNSYYPNINKSQLFAQGYIAKKSGHSRGSTVDVSLVDLSTMKQIDMGSIYDYFGIQSSTFYPNISDSQKNNRMILYNIMINNGFKNYSKEWWHFTLENEPFQEYFDFLVD